MYIPRRKKTPEESLVSDTFKEAAKRQDKKKSKEPVIVAKPTLEASTWPVSHWVTFFDEMFAEFGVPCGDWKTSHISKKKKIVEKFLELSKAKLGNSASVVEATLNLIVTWDSIEFKFFSSKPSEFNLGYIAKAWDSYVRYVNKHPSHRLAVYLVSDEFTKKVNRFIGQEHPAVWLSNPEPVKWDDHGEEINPTIDEELDAILAAGAVRPKPKEIPKEDKEVKVESDLDIDYWL